MTNDRARAEALDAADPLASFRSRFAIADDGLVYLDGNSLGRLPVATPGRIDVVVREQQLARLARDLQLPQLTDLSEDDLCIWNRR